MRMIRLVARYTLCRLPLLPLLLLLITSTLAAQPGSLEGSVRDRESGVGLPGAAVQTVRVGSSESPRGAVADPEGNYRLRGLPAGEYRVSVTSLGYGTLSDTLVTITAGSATRLDVLLEPQELSSEPVIVTASRRPEKATAAPASVSVVTAQEIEEQVAVTTIDYVRGVKGLDVAQGGLAQNTVVARGFNNAFSGTLTTMTDNRFASVPSLRYNGHYFIPLVNEDIERIEIVRGPGSALYGPNAANGVMHLITRSPLSSAGTWISLAGGERSLIHGMFRHAGALGDRIGYKISGQYMQGTDWGYVDTAEQSARTDFIAENPGVDTDTLKIAARDSAMKRFGGEARVDWLLSDEATLVLSTGMTLALNNTDITGVGAAQAQDWQYWYHQARFRWRELFLQAFLNRSNAGETYLLRTGQPIIDRSTLIVAQAQHGARFGERERLTYGLDLILTNPITDSSVTGRNENDDDFSEIGAYVQSETVLLKDQLDLTVALRLDRHSRLDDMILSPRAALVWTPERIGNFRLTYNRAYSAPTTNDMFLDIVGFRTPLFDVRAAGVPQSGYSFRFDEGGDPMFRSHFSSDPAAYYTLDQGHLMWEGVREVVKANAPAELAPLIDALPPPPAGAVGTELRTLNYNTGAFDSFAGDEVSDREGIKPTINTTIELGWQTILFERLGLSIDLYRTHYTDFIGPLETATPSVFYEQSSLAAYLTEALLAGGQDTATARLGGTVVAAQVSGQAGNSANNGVPIGTVTAVEANDPTAVMLTYRNYGAVTLHGIDVGIEAALSEKLSVRGAFSKQLDGNFIADFEGVGDLSLNAPEMKVTFGADWRDPKLGFNAGLLVRHIDGFPVRSGVYNGDVPTYTTVSLDLGYRIPGVTGLSASLSAQNLLTWVDGGTDGPFTQRHIEFVGTPAIGRLVVGRLAYEF